MEEIRSPFAAPYGMLAGHLLLVPYVGIVAVARAVDVLLVFNKIFRTDLTR